MRAAITGGSGFIGGHVIRSLVAAGWEVRALERRGAAIAGATTVAGSLEEPACLAVLVAGADLVVHAAGAVRGRAHALDAVNAAGTARLADALAHAAPDATLVLISSLAARLPAISPYAASKRAGEDALARHLGRTPWVALRAPGVYGAGDRATRGLLRGFAHGLALVPAAAAARFSLLHVDDLARAVLAAPGLAHAGGAVAEVDDGHRGGYGWDALIEAAERALDRRIFRLRVPRAAMNMLGSGNEFACWVRGRPPLLTRAKVREICHDDWVCRTNPLVARTAWRPEIDLDEGLARTFAWYRREGWL